MNKLDNLPEYGNFSPILLNVIKNVSWILVHSLPEYIVQHLSDCCNKISMIVVQNLPEYGNFPPIILNVILNGTDFCTKSP